MSGWPSGLRRQTQVYALAHAVGRVDFWSSIEGVGSNPTSDKYFFSFDFLQFRCGETYFAT